MSAIKTPMTLRLLFPTATNRGRRQLATIITALREGPIDNKTSATAVLRKRLATYPAVAIPDSMLLNRLKELEEEGVIERDINGKRTRRIALTDVGQEVGLEFFVPKDEGLDLPEEPARDPATLGIARHVETRHPAVWDNLTDRERTDLGFLAQMDANLPHTAAASDTVPAPSPAPELNGQEVDAGVASVLAAQLTVNVFRTDDGLRLVIDVPAAVPA